MIPVSCIISGLFAEKILDTISENNRFKIKDKRKKNAILISFGTQPNQVLKQCL